MTRNIQYLIGIENLLIPKLLLMGILRRSKIQRRRFKKLIKSVKLNFHKYLYKLHLWYIIYINLIKIFYFLNSHRYSYIYIYNLQSIVYLIKSLIMVSETNSSFNQNPIKRYFYKSDEAPIQNGSPQTSQPSNFYSPRFLRLSSRLPHGRPGGISPLYPWANLCLFRLRIIMVTLVPWPARLNNLPARITTDFPPQRFIATTRSGQCT